MHGAACHWLGGFGMCCNFQRPMFTMIVLASTTSGSCLYTIESVASCPTAAATIIMTMAMAKWKTSKQQRRHGHRNCEWYLTWASLPCSMFILRVTLMHSGMSNPSSRPLFVFRFCFCACACAKRPQNTTDLDAITITETPQCQMSVLLHNYPTPLPVIISDLGGANASKKTSAKKKQTKKKKKTTKPQAKAKIARMETK